MGYPRARPHIFAMRFFSEFALLARDLHDAVHLYRVETAKPAGLDLDRIQYHIDQAQAEIRALAELTVVRDDLLPEFRDRCRRLSINVEPAAEIVTEPPPNSDADNIDLETFLDEEGAGRGRAESPARAEQPSSSLTDVIQSPQMPTISSHSRAIMSRFNSEDRIASLGRLYGERDGVIKSSQGQGS